MLEKYSTDIQYLKHAVLKEVAAMAFAGTLEEEKDNIPYHIIPGMKPNFRCCVHKEREIIRQRVKLATGQIPAGHEKSSNIVYVIPEGCEGCPLSRFHVTPNCQKCIAKKCVKACAFGAISITPQGAYIDQSKCKECGRCAQVCPYNAITDLVRPCRQACPVNAIKYDDDKIAMIDEAECINCGSCVRDCPFGAISDVSYIVDVIEELKSALPYAEFSENKDADGNKLFAVFAPSIEGQFGPDVTISMLKAAIRKLGFTETFEVALGGDATAAYEAEELIEHKEAGKPLTTSCCPAFKQMIIKHFPELLEYMSTTLSPMGALCRYLKTTYPECKVVFIGPCISKKNEMKNFGIKDNADLVLTFEELCALFDARNIDFEPVEEPELDDGTLYGKEFGVSGGVSNAVMKVLQERGYDKPIKAEKCNGAAECKKMLMLLKAGKFDADILEGMACMHGCIGGPGIVQDPLSTKRSRSVLLKGATKHDVTKNVTQNFDFSAVEMHEKR